MAILDFNDAGSRKVRFHLRKGAYWFLLLSFFAFGLGARAIAQVPGNEISLDEMVSLLDRGESLAGKKVQLSQVLFEVNSTVLTHDAVHLIGKFIHLMQVSQAATIMVSGHTDNTGTPEGNLRLSKDRAKAVYDHMVSAGVEPQRVAYEGFGQDRPVATNQTEEGRRMNRRVEFEVAIKDSDKGKPKQIQDIIVFVNGSKLGAFGAVAVGDRLHYRMFSDTTLRTVPLSEIQMVYFQNGSQYQAPVVKKEPEKILGKWRTVNPIDRAILRMEVTEKDGELSCQTYEKCGENECLLGTSKVVRVAESLVKYTVEQGLAGSILKHEITYLPQSDELQVASLQTYTDGSGRLPVAQETRMRRDQGTAKKTIIPPMPELNAGGFWLDAIYINLGMRRIRTLGDQLEFSMVDDSRYRNSIHETLLLDRSAFTFDFGMEGTTGKYDLGFGYHGFAGDGSGNAFEGTFGYRLVQKNGFLIRPGSSMFIGRGSIYLGEFERNGPYFQINNQQYSEGALSVYLKRNIFAINPHIVMDVPVRGTTRFVRAKVGYSLQLLGGPSKLKFSGLVDDETVTEEKRISAETRFYVDGKSTTRMPFQFSGFFFQLGWVVR
jgi:outer membrane protein OmpA-like peptidoglycan-associated protein